MVNPHIQAANVSKHDFNPRDGDYYVAQATLALAYEQRTANLIKWYEITKSGPVGEESRERMGF